MTEAILIQNTDGTPMTTIPTTDTAFYTNNIKPTQYQNCRISGRVELNSTASSLLANIAIKLKLNAGTLETFNHRLSAAAVGTVNIPIEYVGDISVGGSLTLTAATAVADANTTLTAKNIYVTAIS